MDIEGTDWWEAVTTASQRDGWAPYAEAWILDWLVETWGVDRPFSTNDVWAGGLLKPHERRWIGPVMYRLFRDGYIRKVRRVESLQNHGSLIVQWIAQ